jgi:hypothetical protein
VGAAPLPEAPLSDQIPPVQVFADRTAETEVRVDQPHSVRSVPFTKAALDTRLRITYRDKAVCAGSSNEFSATVLVRIDGMHLPLLDTVLDAGAGSLGGFPIYSLSAPFTTVGWVAGIAPGPHTLDTAYALAGSNAPIVGFISSAPYLIEIAELP